MPSAFSSSAPFRNGFNSAFHAYPDRRAFSMPSLYGHLDPVVQKHLRRVYTVLLTALLWATLGSLLTLRALSNRLAWPATLSSYLVLPSLLLFSMQRPTSKWRAPALHLFAFVDGVAAAPLLSLVAAVNPRIPALAFIAASFVFLSCSVSAVFAKRRAYLFLGSFLFNALFGLVFISFLSSFWTAVAPFGLLVYAGLILFCAFVLYDTQLIIEKAHAGDRDHLQHAFDLLIDFFAIFKRIALIMAHKQANRRNQQEEETRSNSRSNSN